SEMREGVGSRRQHSSESDKGSKATPDPLSGRSVIAGVMEHIEEAGIHSGESAAGLPPYSLPDAVVAELRRQTQGPAKALGVRGLMNVQFAVKRRESDGATERRSDEGAGPEAPFESDPSVASSLRRSVASASDPSVSSSLRDSVSSPFDIYIIEVNPRA